MSVTLRLSRVGKINQPVYRIVACETHSKRDGQFLAILGTYNPSVKPSALNLNQKAFADWQKKGAIVSPGLRKLLPK